MASKTPVRLSHHINTHTLHFAKFHSAFNPPFLTCYSASIFCKIPVVDFPHSAFYLCPQKSDYRAYGRIIQDPFLWGFLVICSDVWSFISDLRSVRRSRTLLCGISAWSAVFANWSAVNENWASWKAGALDTQRVKESCRSHWSFQNGKQSVTHTTLKLLWVEHLWRMRGLSLKLIKNRYKS